MGGIPGLSFQRRCDHFLDRLVGDRAWRTWARFIGQPVKPLIDESLTPLTDHLWRNTQILGDLLIGIACRATQYDPTPLRQCLRGLRPPSPPLQGLGLIIGQHQLSNRPTPTRHPPSLQFIAQLTAQDTSEASLGPPRWVARVGRDRCGWLVVEKRSEPALG